MPQTFAQVKFLKVQEYGEIGARMCDAKTLGNAWGDYERGGANGVIYPTGRSPQAPWVRGKSETAFEHR